MDPTDLPKVLARAAAVATGRMVHVRICGVDAEGSESRVRARPQEMGKGLRCAHPPKRARVHHIRRERALERLHQALKLGLREDAVAHRRLVDLQSGGAEAGGVHELPDGAARSIRAPVQHMLQLPLKAESQQRVASSPAVRERHAVEQEGVAADVHAEDIDGARHVWNRLAHVCPLAHRAREHPAVSERAAGGVLLVVVWGRWGVRRVADGGEGRSPRLRETDARGQRVGSVADGAAEGGGARGGGGDASAPLSKRATHFQNKK